jgi:hypothetical protein
MTSRLNLLSPASRLRIVRIDGASSSDSLTPMVAVLREMLAQWKNNGAIRAGEVELLEGGAFLAVAYEPTGADVSGCTKDQLTHALLDFEARLGIKLLNALPLAVELEGRVRLVDREEFRHLRAEGVIHDETVVFDYLIESLQDFGRFRTTVGQSWYARVGKPKALSS